MRTHLRVAIAAATAALLLAAVTSCADSGNETETSGTPTPSSSAPTSAGPTSPSDTEVASEAASELLRTYYQVRDELRQNPEASLDALVDVAISTELSAQQNLFTMERKDELHQTGSTQIAELTVQSVSLDNSDPNAGKVPTVQIDVCFDVSDVDILDSTGGSVVSPDRADTGWIRYSVANYEWDTDPTGAWRVASSENIEQAPCAAS